MLPADLRAMVDLVKTGAGATGAAGFKALILLLEDAPDSALIVEALSEIDPALVEDEALRAKAADLLGRTEAYDLEQVWRRSGEDASAQISKVIALRPGTAPMAEASNYGQTISFEDIGGLESVKKQIRRKIIRPFENPSLVAKFKRKAGGGVLLYGPPGCGKTMIARAVATEVKAEFTEVRASEILDRYQGVAEARVADMFEYARANRPHVLFFDEVEALAQRRQFDSGHSVNTIVSVLLTEMDNNKNEGILLLGATNIPWSLDSAFRRPGRFDRTLFVPPPDKIARGFILKRLLEGRPVSKQLDVQGLVDNTSGFSGADLEALIETAVDYALDSSLSPDHVTLITNDHFSDAFTEVRASTGEWLSEARNFGEYANQSGMYDDLRDFLKKYGK